MIINKQEKHQSRDGQFEMRESRKGLEVIRASSCKGCIEGVHPNKDDVDRGGLQEILICT